MFLSIFPFLLLFGETDEREERREEVEEREGEMRLWGKERIYLALIAVMSIDIMTSLS